MKRKYIKIIIPVIFFMTIFIVSMLYILLHKNKEAEKGMDYASLSGVTGDSDFQNYWDTDGWYDLVSVEGGYYYMNFEQMLLFLNLETNDVIPVCAKPECNHKTSECNAFFGNGAALRSIYYYRDYIYYFGLSNGIAELCRMDKSGTTRETIAELMPNNGVDSISAVFQGEYAFVYETGGLMNEQETARSIMKVSLATGDKTTVYTVKGKGISITNAKCFGDKIFFTVREADSISDESTNVHSRGLFSYSCGNDVVEEVSDENINDYYVVDGALYYFVTGEGLYRVNIGSDTSQKIWESTDKCDMCSVSSDGKYIYLNNHKYCYYLWELYGFSENRYIILDKDGNLINEILCPDALALYFGDDKYLFYKNMNDAEGLMYMEKDNIDTGGEWKQVFE
mgnify:FL=1